MSITSEADWRGLRGVGHVVHLTLERLAAASKPGVTTRQLDLRFNFVISLSALNFLV